MLVISININEFKSLKKKKGFQKAKSSSMLYTRDTSKAECFQKVKNKIKLKQ